MLFVTIVFNLYSVYLEGFGGLEIGQVIRTAKQTAGLVLLAEE